MYQNHIIKNEHTNLNVNKIMIFANIIAPEDYVLSIFLLDRILLLYFLFVDKIMDYIFLFINLDHTFYLQAIDIKINVASTWGAEDK